MAKENRLGLPYRIQIDVKVPMRDGVRLSGDVYMPFSNGPFPVLMMLTPYDNQSERYLHQHVPRFVEADYAVIIIDSRGRHDSEGEWYAYVNEGRDGHDAQEWLGKQSWCDGNIGTFGSSYPGGTQIWPAPYRSQYLKALVPVAAQVDNYVGMAYMNGVLHHPWGLWHIGMSGRTMQRSTVGLMDRLGLATRLPLVSALDDICESRAYREAIQHYTHDELWKSYGVQDKYHEIEAPAYFITGWYDTLIHDNFNMIQGWRNHARSEDARRFTRLLVGPWPHGGIGSSRRTGDVAFGTQAEVDILGEHVRWYDQRLRGVDTGIDDEPPIRLFVMGDNVWRDEHEWPLARTQYTDFYLHSEGKANSLHGDGSLSQTPSEMEPTDQYDYNPENPVPTIGGQIMDGERSGPRDRRPAERRDDVLVYTSEVLREDLEVTGPIEMTLYAASSAPDTDFTATLVDVHPDGMAINITEGIVRARFRESLENPSLIQPGQVYEYKILVWETSNVFKAGHRIRVEVSSSNFPRLARNLNTGEHPGEDASMQVANQTIHHSSQYASRITLPIIPPIGEGAGGPKSRML
jgi:putative CocE/NonD family hydrolase